MNKSDVELVKRTIDTEYLLNRYLGTPVKRAGNTMWWHSPFRRDTDASLCYSPEKGIHDFGDSRHYDIFSLLMKMYNIPFVTSVEFVANEYGIRLGNEYETELLAQRKKKQLEEEKKIRQTIENTYKKIYNSFCDLYKEWHTIEKALSGRIDLEGYKIALNNVEYLDYLTEYIRDSKPIEIYKRKEDLYGIFRRFNFGRKGENPW